MRREGPEEGASQQCCGGEAPRRRLVFLLAELNLYTPGPPGGIGGPGILSFCKVCSRFLYLLPASSFRLDQSSGEMARPRWVRILSR